MSPLALSKRASALLLCWGVPLLLLHLTDYIAQNSPRGQQHRGLDVVDAFCGEAALSTYYREQGLRAGRFDLNDGESGDILSTIGFLNILRLVLQIKPGGLLFGGPPCGSWVWINRATSKRSLFRIMGDASRQYVRDANSITCRWVLLGMIALARGVLFVTEQPRSSLMPMMAYFKYLALVVRPIAWNSTTFPMGAYGALTNKPSILFGTPKWLEQLKCKLHKKDKARIAKAKEDKKKAMVIKRINKKGQATARGARDESFRCLSHTICQEGV